MHASLDFARTESSFLVFTNSHPGTSPCLVPLAYKCWCWSRFRGACAYAGFAVLVLMLVSRCLCESCRRGRVCLCWFRGAGAYAGFAVVMLVLVPVLLCRWCLCWFRGDYAGAGAGFVVL